MAAVSAATDHVLHHFPQDLCFRSFPVGGRLQFFWHVWVSKFHDKTVTDILRKGYLIPFLQLPALSPVPIPFASYQPGSQKFQVLDQLVSEMLTKCAIELVPSPSPGFYSRLFVVPKASGGWRPVIDLSPLNKFIRKERFTMESPHSVLLSLRQGDWLTSIDLKDAYFHVPIHPSHRRYLRFQWQGATYQFRALCFGLSTAPFLFTRILQPVSAWVHARGIRLTRYLDDWLIAASDQVSSSEHTGVVTQLCQDLGLMVNSQKSDLIPSQTAVYLGMDLDTESFQVRPTEARVDKFLALLRSFLQADQLPALSFLRLLGHMVSLEKLVPGARLRMRSLQFHLRDHWGPQADLDFLVPLSPNLRPDLSWWSDRRHLLHGSRIQQLDPHFLLFTDASLDGWGAHLNDLRAAGRWSARQRSEHINSLELRAVWLGLQAFLSTVQDSSVMAMTDNTTAVGYIRNQGGTRSRQLNHLTNSLLRWSEDHGISLSARHVPGKCNTLADSLSRRGPVSTNWSLNPQVCRALWKLWGQPHMDLFATADNARLPLFVSPVPDQRAWKVDALAHQWTGWWGYAFPPFALIPTVLRKVRLEHATVLLIAPCWPARPWFPDLLALLVDRPRRLPQIQALLRQGRRFHDHLGVLNLHAWKLSGEASEQLAFREQQPAAWPEQLGAPLSPSISPSGQFSAIGAVHGRSILAESLSLS